MKALSTCDATSSVCSRVFIKTAILNRDFYRDRARESLRKPVTWREVPRPEVPLNLHTTIAVVAPLPGSWLNTVLGMIHIFGKMEHDGLNASAQLLSRWRLGSAHLHGGGLAVAIPAHKRATIIW